MTATLNKSGRGRDMLATATTEDCPGLGPARSKYILKIPSKWDGENYSTLENAQNAQKLEKLEEGTSGSEETKRPSSMIQDCAFTEDIHPHGEGHSPTRIPARSNVGKGRKVLRNIADSVQPPLVNHRHPAETIKVVPSGLLPSLAIHHPRGQPVRRHAEYELQGRTLAL